jgi:membrane-associated protease RseP (regulator of RpoE activity)
MLLSSRKPAFISRRSYVIIRAEMNQEFASQEGVFEMENQSNRTVTIAIVTGLIALLFGLCAGAAVGGIGGFMAGRQAGIRAVNGFNRTSPLSPRFSQPQPSQPGPTVPGTAAPGLGSQSSGAGILVQGLVPGSPAMQAGIQSGDVIVQVDGATLDANTRLSDIISAHKPGDTVKITVQRGGSQRTFTVTLGALPTDNQRAYLGIRYTQPAAETATPAPNQ